MKAKLNPKSALWVALFYVLFSIFASLITTIFLGGTKTDSAERYIDQTIDSGMYALLVVMAVLLIISLVVFKDSRRDIFFERKQFALSKAYYLFPLAQVVVILFALFNVDFAAFSMRDILLLIIATLTIGVNEELVTRGILLVGLRNSGMAEWKAWLGTIIVFSLLHLINVIAGGSLMVLVIVLTGGTIWYAARRIFNNLFVPILLHALYDTAFFLLPGSYLVSESLPDHVLDIQLGSFLVLFLLSILFLVFGRKLFKAETVGWS
jgi:membrane protease YdiL (CAAX protease family)